jgi:hypothetical protein
MAKQSTSLPAVRSTATFLAHAMARAQYNATITSVWSPPAQPVIRTSRLIKGYCGRGDAVCELVYIRRNFFLAGMSPVGFCEVPAASENVRSSGKTGSDQRAARTARLPEADVAFRDAA